MRTPVVAVILFTVATYAGGAWAQDVGSRVRVRHDTAEVIGTLIRLDSDSIVVRSDIIVKRQGMSVMEQVAIPVTADTRLDVSLSQHSDAGKGALIGGGIGLGVASLLAILDATGDIGPNSPGEVFLRSALVIALPGALVGFAIGSGKKRDTWAEVPLDLPPQSDPYEVTEGMLRVGLRVNF
jgi:hypothetical protein